MGQQERGRGRMITFCDIEQGRSNQKMNLGCHLGLPSEVGCQIPILFLAPYHTRQT